MPTYKKDNRTQFWTAVYDDQPDIVRIFVAECLKTWFASHFKALFGSFQIEWSKTVNDKWYVQVPCLFYKQNIQSELETELTFAGSECFWPKIPGHKIDDYSLTYCIARDYTQCPDEQDRQTEIGKAFHAAKYESLTSEDKGLYEGYLVEQVRRMLKIYDGCYNRKKAIVAHIPVEAALFDNNLGYRIARGVAKLEGLPFVTSSITVAKPKCKGLRLDEKLVAWQRLYNSANAIETANDKVNGADIIVVDDLYQSGTTMWAFSSYLKRLNARNVLGLACVKSLRDNDNIRD